MKIRLIEEKDIENYINLVNQLNYENDKTKKEVGVSISKYDKSIDDYKRVFLDLKNSNYHYIFVGTINDKIMATAAITICPDLSENLKSFAVAENIIIDVNFRNKGYGRNLLEFIEVFAKQKNCYALSFLSSKHRTNAHEFYKKLGYMTYPINGYKKYL
jgi:GNAT superfamily N-acetyltransferase